MPNFNSSYAKILATGREAVAIASHNSVCNQNQFRLFTIITLVLRFVNTLVCISVPDESS